MNRRAAQTALLVTMLVGLVSGCGFLDGSSSAGKTTKADSGLPATVPATFTHQMRWKADIAAGTTPRTTRYGVVTLTGNAPKYHVTLLDTTTGEPTWTSSELTARAEPHVRLTYQNGRDWIVVWYQDGPASMRVLSFDPHGSGGSDKQPTHAETFSGDSSLPSITVTPRGVLMAKVKDAPAPFVLWLATGQRTYYGTGPSLSGKPGAPMTAYDGGFLVTFSPSGFSYASTTGGWPSDEHTPGGAVVNSGRIIDTAQGVLVSRWKATQGPDIVAVQNIRSGEVLAQQRVVSSAPVTDAASSLVVAANHSWAAWGGYIFNLHGSNGTTFRDLHGSTPTLIHDGVLYLRDTPKSSSESASSQPPASSSRAPNRPDLFRGAAAIDIATGTAVDQTTQVVPIGITSTSHGIFVAGRAGKDAADVMFSVAVK